MALTDKTPLEQDWILQREKAVAWLRVGFAVLAIAVIQLNPSRVERFPILSEVFLGSFLLYSVGALYFAWKNRLGSARVGAISTALDIVWIALIVYFTGGTRTPFFFYYAFPVITASLRWGIKGSVPVALVGVGAYAVMRLTLTAESGVLPIGIDTIVGGPPRAKPIGDGFTLGEDAVLAESRSARLQRSWRGALQESARWPRR